MRSPLADPAGLRRRRADERRPVRRAALRSGHRAGTRGAASMGRRRRVRRRRRRRVRRPRARGRRGRRAMAALRAAVRGAFDRARHRGSRRLGARRRDIGAKRRRGVPAHGTTRGLSGAFLLGASSALVVSPCCAPVIAGIAGLTIAGTRAGDGIVLVAAFSLGHALPLFAAAAVGRTCSDARRARGALRMRPRSSPRR